MLDGEKIKVGGEEMVLPPLNWAGCKRFYQAITGAALGPEIMSELLHAALVRNYPDLTLEQLEDRATPGELMGAIPVLLEISGFTSGEKKGEVKKSRTGMA